MSQAVKLIKQGNSTAVVIPKAALDGADMKRGDIVTIEPLAQGDGFTVRKHDARREKAWRGYEDSESRYAWTYAELAK